MENDNNRGIQLTDLSRFRAELMGLAIIYVIYFHVFMSQQNFFFPLRRLGNVGVDMFLFISGFGLWFSWNGRRAKAEAGKLVDSFGKQYLCFLKRRFLRIYPVWLVVAGYFYTSNYITQTHTDLTPDIPNLILNILCGWSFWRIDDLTFWYVPATMLLYLVAPFYMELTRRYRSYRWLPILAVVFAAMVYYVPQIHHTVGHLEIFFSRVPIFLIGINAGEMIKRGIVLEREAIWLVLLLFVACGWLCMRLEYIGNWNFPLFIERMVYIPFCISAMILECRILRLLGTAPRRCLAFVGGISLEIYLLSIQYVQLPLGVWRTSYAVKALATVILSVIAGWILSKAVAFIVRLATRLTCLLKESVQGKII